MSEMLTQQVLGPVYLIDSPFNGTQGVLGTYVVKGEEPILIDPGPTTMVPGALTGLRELGVRNIRWVGLTHIHVDHSGGAWRMIEAFPDADIYAHPKATEHLVDPSRLVAAAKQFHGKAFDLYGEVRGVSPMKITESKDGETLDLMGATLKVVWTPGHSSHSQSFWEPDYRILIVGDSGGNYSRSGNIFPVSPPPFNPEKAIESISRLIELKPEIICYAHFGYAYEAVKKLVFYREQLALWSSVVEAGVKEGLGMTEIWDRVRQEDPVLRLAEETDPARVRAAMPNLVGLVEYAKWKLANQRRAV